jgi:hypothetical protein
MTGAADMEEINGRGGMHGHLNSSWLVRGHSPRVSV